MHRGKRVSRCGWRFPFLTRGAVARHPFEGVDAMECPSVGLLEGDTAFKVRWDAGRVPPPLPSEAAERCCFRVAKGSTLTCRVGLGSSRRQAVQWK